MTLDRLFETTDWTEERLAKAAKVGQPTINRLRNQKRTASLGLALRIEEATGGKVRAQDLPLSKQATRDLKMVRGPGASRRPAA